MPQSIAQVYIHLIFRTKNGYPFLNKNIRKRLNPYMAAIMKAYEAPVIEINSVSDHIHILFRMSKKYLLSKVIEEIKKQPSRWLKEPEQGLLKFAWQNGYAAFSVSSSKLEAVRNYIKNQEKHHQDITFEQEIEEFMQWYKVEEYDPSYFWD